MKPKSTSTTLSKVKHKSLGGWESAIREARFRIKELKQSIRGLEELRDSGMEFPEPKPKKRRRTRAGQLLGQESDL